MTSRISEKFSALKKQNRCTLVTYLTAGDSSAEATLSYMQTLTEAGADIIELGMPFSDPMADGPVIQRASERALAGGMNLSKVLELVSEFRKTDNETPVILMGYLNPVEAMGYQDFSSRAASQGVDGVLIVDSPPEESSELNSALRDNALDQVFLVSPNSSGQRISAASELGGGFIYYVTVKGVTGSATLDVEKVAARINAFADRVSLPVGVGFGIKTPEHAAAVAQISDAVIIGSALVEVVERLSGDIAATQDALKAKVASFSQAMAKIS